MRREPPQPPRADLTTPQAWQSAARLAAGALLVAIACSAGALPRSEIAASTEPWLLRSQPFRGLLPLKPEAGARLSQALAGTDPGAASLVFSGIRADRTPGAYFEVYLDLAEGAPPPGASSPHYAGNLSLYGIESQGSGASQELAVAAALRALQQGGLWDDRQLAVTLVPQGASEATVRIERVALNVQ